MLNLTQHSTVSIRIHESLYDRVTEWLLNYPDQDLEFAAHPLNLHWKSLHTSQEKVSGFQAGYEFQIDIIASELETLYNYLENKLNPFPHQFRVQSSWM